MSDPVMAQYEACLKKVKKACGTDTTCTNYYTAACFAQAVQARKNRMTKLGTQAYRRGALSGGGHGHHGGGGRRGRGAYFGPPAAYGVPYIDYSPSVLVVGDGCSSRVRSSCAASYPNDPAKQSGCREAGYARCGTSGVGDDAGTVAVSSTTTARRVLILGALAAAATTAFVLSRKKSGKIRGR